MKNVLVEIEGKRQELTFGWKTYTKEEAESRGVVGIHKHYGFGVYLDGKFLQDFIVTQSEVDQLTEAAYTIAKNPRQSVQVLFDDLSYMAFLRNFGMRIMFSESASIPGYTKRHADNENFYQGDFNVYVSRNLWIQMVLEHNDWTTESFISMVVKELESNCKVQRSITFSSKLSDENDGQACPKGE